MFRIRQELIFGVAAAGMLALFVFVVVLPQQRTLNNIRSQLTAAKDQMAFAELECEAAARVRAQLEELQDGEARIRRMIPSRLELGEFLERLSEVAALSELVDQHVAPEPAQKMAGVEVLPVKMTFESTFSSLFEFVKRIESLDRLVRISKLQIVRSEQSPSVIKAEMTLQIFSCAS